MAKNEPVKSIEILYHLTGMFRMNQNQDVISIDNHMKTLVMTNSMGLVKEAEILGAVASPNGKTFYGQIVS